MEKVGVIILNYNSSNATLDAVNKVRQSKNVQTHIYVVDNNSDDNSLEVLNSQSDGIKVIETGYNGGYAYGNNIGLRAALKDDNDFFCILNTDVDFSECTLQKLLDEYPRNSECIFGPTILQSDGKIIQSVGAKTNYWIGRNRNICGGEAYSLKKSVNEVPDYISGAFLLFSRETLTRAGFLPENYFLYYEENEWCVRASRKGVTIKVSWDVTVRHAGSVTVGEGSVLKKRYMNRNRMIFMRRNASTLQFFSFSCYLLILYVRDLMLKRDFTRFKEFWAGYKSI
jgi:GT2 family glycosyltransferase